MMTTETQRTDGFDGDSQAPLTEKTAMRLLELGLHGPAQPLDDLIDRLRGQDGDAWFIEVMQRGLTGLDTAASRTSWHSASLDELTQLKNQAKSRMTSGTSHADLIAALAIYTMSVAAALAQHGVLISSRPRTVWDDELAALATFAPEPYRAVLLQAVEAVSR